MKRIQSHQMQNLTEIMKSNKEIQCVRPQIRDHSNKVLVLTVKPISQSSFVGEMIVGDREERQPISRGRLLRLNMGMIGEVGVQKKSLIHMVLVFGEP